MPPLAGPASRLTRFPAVLTGTAMATQAQTDHADQDRITALVLDFMARPSASDDDFNDLALQLFARQLRLNLPYQRFCQLRGKTARNVKSWRDIPAVPIDAFKDFTLSCVPPEQCERVFMTSGTTRGDVKGRHHHPHLAVYDASMRRNFSQHFMRGQARLTMGILFPDEQVMPNSSLAHYLALAVEHFGGPGSAYYLDSKGLRLDALCAALAQAQSSGQPMALLGASYSLVHVMDALAERQLSFQLPPGSRLLDTGGFKSQSRDMPMNEFYEQLASTFGISRADCINMYGMTELSTQFYDAGNAVVPSVKRGPHWIASRLVDPVTGQDVPAGERGILAHTDLGNVNSVCTILTQDVGVATDGGFLLLGRAEGAQAKGCSLAVEEFLGAARA